MHVGISGRGTMRDVIVVGAGGAGPVVAKELAVRGLDVLLLEAGPEFAHSEREWSHLENEANNPASGIFRFGPGDRTQPPWARDLPQNCFLWQTAGVGGSTVHYFANSPRAMPGAFSDYTGADAADYDRIHIAPLGYRELIPYYEWVEHTLPVQTAAMGAKEERFLTGAAKLGLPHQTSKDITGAAYRPQENAILQPQGTAGRTNDPKKLTYPAAKGCTFCGYCPQGCIEPVKAPRNLRAKRSTHTSYIPMALTADRWTHGKAITLLPDSFAVRIETEGASATGVTWRHTRTGRLTTEETKVVVLAAGPVETPRLQGQALTSSDSGIAGFYDNGARVGAWGANAVGRLVGERLKRFMHDIDRLMGIAVITDDDVLPQNRVTLSAAMAPDAHGPIPFFLMMRRPPRTLK